jgi:hypothetical protein
MVAVSPFPALPLFVGLPSVPHPGEQAVPPLVRAQFAPAKLPLLWLMNAVKTDCVPEGIDDGTGWSANTVVFCPILHPIPLALSRKIREQARAR